MLAEVVRGHPRDAGVFAGLRQERVEVHPVDSRVGVRAGQLLGATRWGSEHAGGALVATVDTRDLTRLAAHATNVVVADIAAR